MNNFIKSKMSENEIVTCGNTIINSISNITTCVVISFFIILKVVEIVMKQINQNKNFIQQNEKIKIMNEQTNSQLSEEELNKKITEIVGNIRDKSKHLSARITSLK